MNIKLRLAEDDEEEMDGPTLELVFTKGEMHLKEEEERGEEEEQQLCSEGSGKGWSEPRSSPTPGPDGRLLAKP